MKASSQFLLDSALASSSKKAYDSVWEKYFAFARFHSLPISLPIPPDQLLWFFTDIFQKGLSYSSLPPMVSALSYRHKLAGVEDSTKSFRLQQLLAALKRTNQAADSRQPLTPVILRALLRQIDRSHWAIYDRCLFRAMFLLAFHFGLRLGEITDSPHNLARESVVLAGATLRLTFNSFKHAVGPPITHEVVSSYSPICPVAAIKSFLVWRGSSPGPLFLLAGKSVKPYTFNSTLKSLLCQCNIQERITSHSFRIGAATWWAQLNYSEARIKQLGRWRSNAFLKYIRGPVAHPAV